MRKTYEVRQFARKKAVIFVSGLLLGALVILAFRFVTYKHEHVHYHANFAVFLNGEREKFSAPTYYQPVSICMANKGISNPEQRAHMHGNNNALVHVHDHAVTWGQFFENIGWYVGPDFIETADGTKYVGDDNNSLHVLLNGQDYTDLTPITNMVIKDKARLLLSFGKVDESTLRSEFTAVPRSADHYDGSKDPASCSSGEATTLSDRLHHLL